MVSSKSLHCVLSLAVQCIVIGPVCGSVTMNLKLCASIFTKLGLYVKVVTISSWLNLAVLLPPEGGLRRGENFWLRLTIASAQCLRLAERFFLLKKRSVLKLVEVWNDKQQNK